jgi:O-antigen ligase
MSGFPENTARPARPTALLILEAFVVLITVLPARLVIGTIGAFGSPASIVGLCAFGMWAAGALRPGLLARTVLPVRVATVALWLPALLSFAVMHLHAVPSDEVRAADRFILFLLVWSGVALLAAEGLRDRSEVMRLLRVVVAGAATCSIVALVQSRLNYDFTTLLAKIPGLSAAGELTSVLTRSGLRRPAGTATHPIEFGCVLAMTLGPALVLAVHDHAWPALRRWGALILIGLGIPIGVSRSAIVGAGIAGVFWFATADMRQRVRALIALGLFTVTVFLTTPGLIGTLASYFRGAGSDTSISTRTDDYSAVAPFIRNSPWIGRGPGTFLPKFRILDNQWLGSLIEVGIFGVIGLIIYVLTPAFLGRSIRRDGRDPMIRSLGQSFVGLRFVVAFCATTFDFLSFPMAPGVLVVLLGCAGALWAMRIDDGARDFPMVAPVARAGTPRS